LGVKFLMPRDHVCSEFYGPGAKAHLMQHIADNMMGMDIGPKTTDRFVDAIMTAGTVVWNGPMGVFEFPAFAEGTRAVARAMTKTNAISIIGGGDSAAAVEKFGFADRVDHVSTGGGASLELLEGRELPGIACLEDQ